MSAGAEAPRPSVPLWLLALITFSGTVGMYLFVPALPGAAIDLGATTGAMQLTVSLYVLGLALGQPVYGPLSDRFGRRPVLVGGLVLYTLAGLVACLAPNAEVLIAARLFQALGGCAGLVLGRAIVRDTSEAKLAAQRLALLNLMVTVGPGLAPLLGSAVVATAGWRVALVLLCLLGVANLAFTWRLLPETGLRDAPPDGPTLVRDYLRLLGSPVFLGYAVCGGCMTTASYAFFGSAPFIFRELGRPEHEAGIYLALLIIGISIGNWLASRLIARAAIDRVLRLAGAVSLAATVALLAVVLAGWLSVASAMGCMFVFTICVGVGGPSALAQSISLNPRVVGSASGIYGFIQMAVGALCSGLAGLGQDPALAASLVLVGAALTGQVALRLALRGKRRAEGG
ncbi:MFS transporter, DHA1 family, bicyclomycin/chloramphenicol resistance protein [Roseomonas rosea]|uniref:Bcr/CflA family efflux transporter n=1 Tax=Muricoccus roseus TaxID=198092 RepID=A0A1M6FSN7_9PROT|nr:multidrug effflux MFS transporter [Roseomonas rosea]SHJ00682.1 MFS transporter, DHA1 family, bicyclomycin/chloramphenicol resistance protein [Roseomonas rosea]